MGLSWQAILRAGLRPVPPSPDLGRLIPRGRVFCGRPSILPTRSPEPMRANISPRPHQARRLLAATAVAALAVPLLGCNAEADDPKADSAAGYPVTVDNCGTEVTFDAPPGRVVTIKSTSTELMLALGLADRIVGTAFADGPVPAQWTDEAADLEVHHTPVFGDGLADIRFADLAELYAIMIEHHSAAVVAAIDRIASAESSPVLVHCTAGKDRTGVVVGVLLEVLGAERDDILGDYERSQMLLNDAYLADLFAGVNLASLPGGAAHRATASPRVLLDTALDDIASRYGSAEGLLVAHGMSRQRIARMREALVVESGHR